MVTGIKECKYVRERAASSRKVKEGQGRKRVHGYCPWCNVIVSRSGREDQKEK